MFSLRSFPKVFSFRYKSSFQLFSPFRYRSLFIKVVFSSFWTFFLLGTEVVFSKTFLFGTEVFFNSCFDFFSNLFVFKLLSFRYWSIFQDFFYFFSFSYCPFPYIAPLPTGGAWATASPIALRPPISGQSVCMIPWPP